MTAWRAYVGADDYQLSQWLHNMRIPLESYAEPILDHNAVEFIHLVCTTLNEDRHVFVMSVDVLESYIAVNNQRRVKIEDQIITVEVIAFICGKWCGEKSEQKIDNLKILYERLTEKTITHNQIRTVEREIMMALNMKLPLHSQLDDLKQFVYVFMQTVGLKIDLVEFCAQIFDVVYIHRKELFYRMKSEFVSRCRLDLFEKIVTNKFFLIGSVLICAFRLTKLENFFDVHIKTVHISKISMLAVSDVKQIAEYIYELVKIHWVSVEFVL